MKIFNLKKMEVYPYKERDKNVFYKTEEFKIRIIELPSGGEMPDCEMDSYVIFNIIRGSAEVKVNGEKRIIKEGEVLITEPATLSMRTKEGVKIMGIQIVKK